MPPRKEVDIMTQFGRLMKALWLEAEAARGREQRETRETYRKVKSISGYYKTQVLDNRPQSDAVEE